VETSGDNVVAAGRAQPQNVPVVHDFGVGARKERQAPVRALSGNHPRRVAVEHEHPGQQPFGDNRGQTAIGHRRRSGPRYRERPGRWGQTRWAAGKIEIYAKHLASTMPRSAPVQLLARDGAASSPDAAEIWKQIRHETLTAMTMFASDLAHTGELRVSAIQARDVLWTYHAPELYELLVLERGWSATRYGKFIAHALIDALLENQGRPE
jgi:hypothetical protein